MKEKIDRIFEIDILRFIAAIVVVFFHSTFRGQYFEVYNLDFPTLSIFTKYGFLGVDLFFIISGFVILMSVQNKNAVGFLKSRIIRLYPSFWFGVTFVALVCFFWGPSIFKPNFWQYLVNMSMLGGFFNVQDIDGVYWTLYVEIQFYAFVFMLMLLGKIKYILALLYIWACASILNIAVLLPWKIQYALILSWAHYFIAGSLFYLIRRDGLKKLYALLLTIVFVISLVKINERMASMSNTYGVEFSAIIGYIVISMIFFVMLLVALKKISFVKHSKIYIILGSLSYPIYLLHHNAGFTYMMHMQNYMNKYLIIITLLLWVLGLSYLVTLYEKWMSNKLKLTLERF